MNLFYRFLICCVVALPVSGFYYAYANKDGVFSFDLAAALAFLAVALVCVGLCGLGSAASSGSTASLATAGAGKAGRQKPKSSGKRMQGEVKWFNGGKGFGFISADNGEEYFVHFRSVRKDSARLSPGKRVEFGLVQGKKGDEADDVCVL
ncbi:MAG: cold shock domain-containing protein [Pseudomonadales bacterium]